MNTIGICNAEYKYGLSPHNLSFEDNNLYIEAQKKYDKVMLINPESVHYTFNSQNKRPDLQHQHQKLNNLSTLIVRSTKGCELSISLLANTLHALECDVVDPPERFSGTPAGKLLQAYKGCKESTLPKTGVIFNANHAHSFINEMDQEFNFPLIVKPDQGKRGDGVELVNDKDELNIYIRNFFSKNTIPNTFLIVQEYIKVIKEFRGIVIGGEVIGLCEKIPGQDKIRLNAAKGSLLMQVENNEIKQFIEKHSSNKGIIGVDVVINDEQKLYILESNRAPGWKYFMKATGINVGEKIIDFVFQRVPSSNMLF
ncbi:MAG: hypothetical protein JXJ22_10675 [Bacteroidales bacterium]|nr:hypothetical protein [Bacteroidales bacterium]